MKEENASDAASVTFALVDIQCDGKMSARCINAININKQSFSQARAARHPFTINILTNLTSSVSERLMRWE
jgi:hypothetical protein